VVEPNTEDSIASGQDFVGGFVGSSILVGNMYCDLIKPIDDDRLLFGEYAVHYYCGTLAPPNFNLSDKNRLSAGILTRPYEIRLVRE